MEKEFITSKLKGLESDINNYKMNTEYLTTDYDIVVRENTEMSEQLKKQEESVREA